MRFWVFTRKSYSWILQGVLFRALSRNYFFLADPEGPGILAGDLSRSIWPKRFLQVACCCAKTSAALLNRGNLTGHPKPARSLRKLNRWMGQLNEHRSKHPMCPGRYLDLQNGGFLSLAISVKPQRSGLPPAKNKKNIFGPPKWWGYPTFRVASRKKREMKHERTRSRVLFFFSGKRRRSWRLSSGRCAAGVMSVPEVFFLFFGFLYRGSKLGGGGGGLVACYESGRISFFFVGGGVGCCESGTLANLPRHHRALFRGELPLYGLGLFRLMKLVWPWHGHLQS